MEILILLTLILVACFTGKFAEHRHYKSIRLREKKWLRVPVTNVKKYDGTRSVTSITLASGSVVISVDHFKRLLAGLTGLFGGEVVSYSSLLDRGRREAILRMKEAAPQAHLFLNARVETTSLASGRNARGEEGIAAVEFVAYATALEFSSAPAK